MQIRVMFKFFITFLLFAMQCTTGLARFRRHNHQSRALGGLMDQSLGSLFPVNEALKVIDDIDSWVKKVSLPVSAMPMDINEGEDAFHVYIDLPGVAKKDINISIKGKELCISATRSTIAGTLASALDNEGGSDTKKTSMQESEEEKVTIVRTERFCGAISRSFVLPDSVDTNKIEAKSEDGVLHIRIPKLPEAKTEWSKSIHVM